MTSADEPDREYIRPCGAFPDGYWVRCEAVPELMSRDLICESDTWEGDYQAIYDGFDDDEMDRVAQEIEEVAERYERWLAT